MNPKLKMELKIIEEKKNKLVFELKGETHTFCAALKNELLEDKHIKVASYHIAHPLEGIPRFIVETDGNETPKKALADAAKRIDSVLDKFKEAFSKGIK